MDHDRDAPKAVTAHLRGPPPQSAAQTSPRHSKHPGQSAACRQTTHTNPGLTDHQRPPPGQGPTYAPARPETGAARVFWRPVATTNSFPRPAPPPLAQKGHLGVKPAPVDPASVTSDGPDRHEAAAALIPRAATATRHESRSRAPTHPWRPSHRTERAVPLSVGGTNCHAESLTYRQMQLARPQRHSLILRLSASAVAVATCINGRHMYRGGGTGVGGSGCGRCFAECPR